MSEKESHTFDDLIQQINQTARDIQRERGTLFEKLVLSYLRNEPTYQRLYKNVWTFFVFNFRILKMLIIGLVANSFAYEYNMGRRFFQKSSTIQLRIGKKDIHLDVFFCLLRESYWAKLC